MRLFKSFLIGFFWVLSLYMNAQKDDCSKFYDYFNIQDYQNTIKSIQKCKKINNIQGDDAVILDFFLHISYYALSDYDNFSAESLERALKKSNGVLNGLYVQAAQVILKNYYSEQSNLNKEKETHINFLAQSIKNFGDIGNYKNAIEISEQLLKEIESFYGKNYYYANALHSLAYYYAVLGNFGKAILINTEALEIIENDQGSDTIYYALWLSYLASYYSLQGNKIESTNLCEKCLKILNKKTVDVNKDFIPIYHNLSICYAQSDMIEEAINLQSKSLEIAKKLLNPNQIEYALILNNLSKLYSNIENYNKSISLGEQASEIFNNQSFQTGYLISLNNLAFDYLKIGDFSRAYRKKADYFYKLQNFIIPSQFSWLSEMERDFFWQSVKSYLLELYFFNMTSNNYKKFSELSYNSALLSKGLILQSSQALNNLLLESGNQEVVEKAEELRTIYHTLNRLYEKPIAERYLNADSLETVAQNLERELLAQSKECGDYTRFMSITWQDVQKNLGEKDVAIEFVEFPVLKSDSIMYAALVLRKDWEHPQMISLFEKKQIEQYLQQSPEKQYAGFVGKQLYQLMWKPLKEVIQQGENVYFSAAGVYHQLALEYLPSDDGTPLCDLYNFRRLSSSRQLALDENNVAIKSATLYGGIQYDVNPTQMLTESKKYQKEESLYAYRGTSVDSLRGNKWVTLDNTVPEIEFISDELNRNKVQATVFTSTNANEESLKDLSGKKINILHLATHGFFLPIEETRKIDYFQMLGRDNNPTPDMSMRRSGLVMAGGNGAWSGDSIPEGIDDGILTAQEISVLDFREMDLVVLSACETGLGDINTSEGVFGLQRAFKKAGAKTLIMSLWKVNDEITKTLMNKFYQSLFTGKSKHEAFLEAQQFIRSRHPEPQNWAAFIMLD